MTVQLTIFQAEKHTYTNSNLLCLKIELLNQKCQAQGRVTCPEGRQSSLPAPIIPTHSRCIRQSTSQLCVIGPLQRRGSVVASYPLSSEDSKVHGAEQGGWEVPAASVQTSIVISGVREPQVQVLP